MWLHQPPPPYQICIIRRPHCLDVVGRTGVGSLPISTYAKQVVTGSRPVMRLVWPLVGKCLALRGGEDIDAAQVLRPYPPPLAQPSVPRWHDIDATSGDRLNLDFEFGVRNLELSRPGRMPGPDPHRSSDGRQPGHPGSPATNMAGRVIPQEMAVLRTSKPQSSRGR